MSYFLVPAQADVNGFFKLAEHLVTKSLCDLNAGIVKPFIYDVDLFIYPGGY